MRFIYFMVISLVFHSVISEKLCNLQPEILSSVGKGNSVIISPNIYFYIPVAPFSLHNNSIIIFNEYGEVFDCLNQDEFIEKNNLEATDIYFLVIKHVTEDIFVISFLSFDKNTVVEYGAAKWVFIDGMFNIKKNLPTIDVANSITSFFFNPSGNINLHDIVVDEELKYAIIIVKQKYHIKDVESLFPKSLIKEFDLAFDGLCAVDLETGKEMAAISGDGVFIEVDKWWEYLDDIRSSRMFYYDLIDKELFKFGTEDGVFDGTYVNSLNLVEGSHFSPKYDNEKLILLHAKLQDTTYLIRWDLENVLNRDSIENDNFEIIWKLPSYRSPRILREEWAHRWEYVNDPFFGTSNAHDVNTFNLPKGHVLMMDNGVDHRVSNRPGIACPMTRYVEYKIETDYMGRMGFHRITLVFSFPKIEDYPKIIYMDNEPPFNERDCKGFWERYNFQEYIGSFRKLDDGDYVMTYYPPNLLTMEVKVKIPRMLRVDNKGEIVNSWYTLTDLEADIPVSDFSSSYRINPINTHNFRKGLYFKFITERNNIV